MQPKRAYIFIFLLFAQFFVLASFESVAWGRNTKPALSDWAQLNYAEFLYDDGDYIGAAREFERFIALFPGNVKISEAQFKIAESYVAAGDYVSASEVLDRFINNFPDDKYAAEAELMLWTLAGEGAALGYSVAGVKEVMPAREVEVRTVSVKKPEVEALPVVKIIPKVEEVLVMREDIEEALPWADTIEEALAGTAVIIIEEAPLLDTEKVVILPELSVPEGKPRQSVKIEALPDLTPRLSAGDKTLIEAPVEEEPLSAKHQTVVIVPEIEESLPEKDFIAEDSIDTPEPVDTFAALKETTPTLKDEMREALTSVPKASSLPAKDVLLASDDAPLRAVQVMYFNGRSMGEIDDEMKVLASSGINTIFLRVFHNDGDTVYPHIKASGDPPAAGLYFKSEHAPVVSDMLAALTERAHSHGLRVFAWMTARYADYGVEYRGDLACRGYDISSGDIVRCKGLDVFNDDVVKRLSAIYTELAAYDIDGILFQDDLVLRHTEGFGAHAEKKYMEATGRVLSPGALYYLKPEGEGVEYTPEFWKWASWKNKTLLGVADELKRAVREVNPDIKFAINLMYEAVTNPGGGLAWLSQDLTKAREIGFDYYSIMAYHRQMGDELGKSGVEIKDVITELVADAVEIIGEPEKVLIKFQTIDWNTSNLLPYGEVIGLVRSVKRVDDVSLAVVPYKKGFPFYELTRDNELVLLK